MHRDQHSLAPLANIGDGAQFLQVSVDMLRVFHRIDVRTIVSTPHLDGPLDEAYRARVQTAFQQVAARARGYGGVLERE